MIAEAGDHDRDLSWDGCVNVRDLGGLPTGAGGRTRWGAVVRADNPARLSASGWQSLHDYGVRTIVALRTLGADDDEPDPALVHPAVAINRIELEDLTDVDFRRRCVDNGWWATPLQWAVMLRHWPERCAAAVAAVARAEPGGVVVSCGIGRDRTGLVAFMLLALVGVPLDDLSADWLHSMHRLSEDPHANELPVLEVLEREQTSVSEAIEAALALDVEARLLAGGLRPADLSIVRERLLG